MLSLLQSPSRSGPATTRYHPLPGQTCPNSDLSKHSDTLATLMKLDVFCFAGHGILLRVLAISCAHLQAQELPRAALPELARHLDWPASIFAIQQTGQTEDRCTSTSALRPGISSARASTYAHHRKVVSFAATWVPASGKCSYRREDIKS